MRITPKKNTEATSKLDDVDTAVLEHLVRTGYEYVVTELDVSNLTEAAMTDKGPVLVVGGTGMLGGQVVTELLARGKQVRALVRVRSDATRLKAAGATIARGDMMIPGSLRRAMDGVDCVITTAAGYTRHRKGDTPKPTSSETPRSLMQRVPPRLAGSS